MEQPIKKALIIDDDPDICLLLEQILKYKKLEPFSAGSLAKTRSILSDICPHVIFVDHRLPDGLGLDYIPSIRLRCPEARIIAMTAQDAAEHKAGVLKKGADFFLEKPFLIDKIYELLDDIA